MIRYSSPVRLTGCVSLTVPRTGVLVPGGGWELGAIKLIAFTISAPKREGMKTLEIVIPLKLFSSMKCCKEDLSLSFY